MTRLRSLHPLHHPAHLLVPSGCVLLVRGGVGDGNYTLLVECVVVSKLLAKVLKKGDEGVGTLVGERHCVCLREYGERTAGEGEKESLEKLLYRRQLVVGSHSGKNKCLLLLSVRHYISYRIVRTSSIVIVHHIRSRGSSIPCSSRECWSSLEWTFQQIGTVGLRRYSTMFE